MSAGNLSLQLVLSANADQAKREMAAVSQALAAVRSDTQGAAAAQSELGAASMTAAGSLNASGAAAEHLGSAATGAERGVRAVSDASRQAERGLDGKTRAANHGAAALTRLRGVALSLGPALAAAFSLRLAQQMVDGWSDMQSRIGAAIRDMEAAPALMQDMLRLANDTYSGLNQTVETFAANIGVMRDLGYSTKDAKDYTESLNHMLVITATKGEQAASVQNALSRAMATGKLQAQGLDMVLANGGRVAQALAEELGVTVNELRDLASQGKITGDVIARALIRSLKDVREEAAEMPSTISDGFLRIGNSITAVAGRIDKAFGASAGIAEAMNAVATGIGNIAAADFSGLSMAMATGAETLGQGLLILAATRIPALVVSIGTLNISGALMTAQFTAGAIASRGLAAALGAQAVAARGLAAAMTLAGGPIGLVAAGVAALGLALYNEHRAARRFSDAMRDLEDVGYKYDRAMSDFHDRRTRENSERLKQLADEKLAVLEISAAEAQKEVNRIIRDDPASFAANLIGRETAAVTAARAELDNLRNQIMEAAGISDMLAAALGDSADEVERAAGGAFSLTTEQERALETANEMLRSYERRAELASLEAQYGSESVIYQIQQLAHEREIIAARVNSLDVADEIKLAILEAADASLEAEGKTFDWDHAMGILLSTTQDTYSALRSIAETEPPGNWLEGAIGQARDLAAALWDGAAAMAASAGDFLDRPEPPKRPERPRPPRRSSGGGGRRRRSAGGGAAGGKKSKAGGKGPDKEAREAEQRRKAVTDLIGSLERELELLRELDPVKQDMIRRREVMAHATDAERKQVEDLIRTRRQEAAAMEEAQARMRETETLGRNVIGGIFSSMREGASIGNILIGVLDRIAGKLAEIAQQNLADLLFGHTNGQANSGIGGWVGAAIGAVRGLGVKANALGDVIGAPTLFAYGDRPGQLGVMGEAGAEAIMPLTHAMGGGVGALIGGRETTIPLARLASGKLGVQIPEMVGARAFAKGAAFGIAPPPAFSPSSAAGSPSGDMRVHMSFDLRGAEGDASIERKLARAMDGAQAQLIALLPDKIKLVMSDPRLR